MLSAYCTQYIGETLYPNVSVSKATSQVIGVPFIAPYDGIFIVTASGSTQTDGAILSLAIGNNEAYALPRASCIGNGTSVVSCEVTHIMSCKKGEEYNVYAHAENKDLIVYNVKLSFVGLKLLA